jgi:RAMA domain-containing protein
MTTDYDIHEPPDHTTANIGASQPNDETTMRAWEGLPPDTMILAPAFTPPPMRCPDDMWAMLVTAVDIIGDADPDRPGDVALFAGNWIADQPPADSLYDGDLVVRLTHPADPTYPLPRDHAIDVEMLLAYQGRWQRVGQWRGVDDGWPGIVAPTAAVVMSLHNDAAEEIARRGATPSWASAPYRWVRGSVADLLEAGLLEMGDVVVWNRRSGVRHVVRICINGTLILTGGCFCATPSGAITALSGGLQNGWAAFQRASDGRTLGDLRTELRARRGQ